MRLAEFMNIVKLRSDVWLADMVCWNNGRYEPKKNGRFAALRNSGVKNHEKFITVSHCATKIKAF